MECRKFEITLVSAKNLPNLRSHDYLHMKVYAEVSLNGEFKSSKKTNVDVVGESNPTWNFPLDYMMSESSIDAQELEVVVKLYCERRTRADKFISEVKIPVKSLFDSRTRAANELSCVVPGPEDGKLKILYNFGDVQLVQVCSAPEPSSAYWKKAMKMGMMVLVQGAWIFLTGEISLL